MHAVMRYRIHHDHLGRHLDLLHAVYEELREGRPAALTWTVYQLEDPLEFLEIVSGSDLPHPLPELPAFQRYRSELEARCTQLPSFTEMRPVDSYTSPNDR